MCLLAGRTEAISRYKKTCPDLDDAEINSRLVAYCSDQVKICPPSESNSVQSLRRGMYFDCAERDMCSFFCHDVFFRMDFAS